MNSYLFGAGNNKQQIKGALFFKRSVSKSILGSSRSKSRSSMFGTSRQTVQSIGFGLILFVIIQQCVIFYMYRFIPSADCGSDMHRRGLGAPRLSARPPKIFREAVIDRPAAITELTEPATAAVGVIDIEFDTAESAAVDKDDVKHRPPNVKANPQLNVEPEEHDINADSQQPVVPLLGNPEGAFPNPSANINQSPNPDALENAGPGDCVSMKEVAQYYCYRVQEEKDGCAKTSTDCDHLFGCKVCKAGAKTFWPEDTTNCMECQPGYKFINAGFIDCTGTCEKLPDGEVSETGKTETVEDPWHYKNLDHFQFEPVGRDKASKSWSIIDDNIHEILDTAKKSELKPSLALVTTTGPTKDPDKRMLQQAAATSWEALNPNILTFVAVDSSNISSPRNLPRIQCSGNPAGTPFVSSLFVAAEDLAIASEAKFAGYTNGDIAFDVTLMDVLDMVHKLIAAGQVKKKVLIVGKRLNIDSSIDNAEDLVAAYDKDSDMPQWKRAVNYRRALMKASRKRRNSWMAPLAEDFFLFSPGTFDWDELPNWIIGRVGYDSFLTQWALDDPEIDVIDASKMIHAAHLTGDDGNAAGWNTGKPDKVWNYCAVHHMCESFESWKPHCDECFRCKLGGTDQSNFWVGRSGKSTSEVKSGSEFYRLNKRHAKPEADPQDVKTESEQILTSFGIPTNNVVSFLERLKAGENRIACEESGNCCSISGPHALEYELGMRWQVRSEWPLNGDYAGGVH